MDAADGRVTLVTDLNSLDMEMRVSCEEEEMAG
jgi:hypothetical protein